nr:type II secretion system protein [Paenibacillus lemnae]
MKEQGFTLLEVLAAIVILSIVSLVLTSYFSNALSYSKYNQNKTVMVNLARNALFYMEKQDYDKIKELFEKREAGQPPSIQGRRCSSAGACAYSSLFKNAEVLPDVLNPVINNVQFELEIAYQEGLHDNMKTETRGAEAIAGSGEKQMADYLIPLSVKVTGPGGPRGKTVETVVEGYISDEKIR